MLADATEPALPKLAFRTPLLERIDAFKKRRPDIPLCPWYQSKSGKWETTEPGSEDPRTWVNGTAMMEHLEKAYPDDGTGLARRVLSRERRNQEKLPRLHLPRLQPVPPHRPQLGQNKPRLPLRTMRTASAGLGPRRTGTRSTPRPRLGHPPR